MPDSWEHVWQESVLSAGIFVTVHKKELRGLLLGLFITDIFGFVITLKAQVDGMMNPYGWILVAVWFLLALGLGYLRFFMKK